MSTTFVSLVFASLLASPIDDPSIDLNALVSGPAAELRFSGSVSKRSRNGADSAEKQFTVYCLLTNDAEGRNVSFLVNEQGAGQFPWAERYGQVELNDRNQPQSDVRPRVLQEYDGTHYPLALRPVVFPFAEKLKPGSTWTSGKHRYEVQQSRKVGKRECWQVDVSTNFGREQVVFVDKQSPLVVSAQQRVFLGQGVQFEVSMKLDSARPLGADELARLQAPLETLIDLQQALKRPENATKPELNSDQLEAASTALPRLSDQAEDTPFAPLAAAIRRDVKSQQERSEGVDGLAKKFVGQPMPPVLLKSLTSGKTIDSDQYDGKILVLHFWEYQGKLEEPYGQVGYLDFLHGKMKRRKLDSKVQIYGVAVDERLGNPNNSGAAKRAIRSLTSFMNVGYELLGDDGTVLRKFGDPRRLDAKLPLWVVVGADGKIAHYKVGFYDINVDEGLRELEDVVVELIRKQREE